MAARAAVNTLLAEDTALADLGVEAVYGSNSIDSPTEDCFIVIRWETDDPRVYGRRAPNRCTIWAHDTDRDYGRIDKVLERVDELLTGTVHREGADGWTLTLAEFNTHGPDLRDDGFNTVTRWSDFTVVSRYSST